MVLDLLLDSLGPAHWSLLLGTVVVLIYPRGDTAVLAIEFLGTFAVITDVLEIELGFTLVTLFCRRSTRDQFFGFWLCRQL